MLDTVRFYAPNTTNTKRWGVTTSLIWDINDDNRAPLRLHLGSRAASPDRAVGPLEPSGDPEDVFAGRQGDRVFAADGEVIRGRDRFSIAELNQFALEWRGQFAGRQIDRHGRRARAVLQA